MLKSARQHQVRVKPVPDRVGRRAPARAPSRLWSWAEVPFGAACVTADQTIPKNSAADPLGRNSPSVGDWGRPRVDQWWRPGPSHRSMFA